MNKTDFQDLIEIPASTAELKRVRRAVRKWSREATLSASRRRALVHAVDETVANAIEHGVGKNNNRPISIAPIPSKDALGVMVTYEGAKFNPLDIDFNTHEALHNRRVHGYGLALCRRLVDDIRYRYHNGTNEITLLVSVG